ncbi:Uncharacterised protein [Legionella wadsworthii]|uniref:Uncharacterized protein n=1 Tax=Legionella wadsworthii TaxID=28088 RepID=A0A378LVK3_9GAMM|nr:STY0301 family protein [Legionella wadsworthii]STY29852.1 Uncharacterised protein [Legionella wadsworthii]
MKISAYLKFTSVFFLFSHGVAAITVSCPKEIQTNQSLKSIIKGWSVFIDGENHLSHFTRITFYSGPPQENASLAPDDKNSTGKKMIWNFNEGNIWLSCGYSNTSIQLIQKLPDKIKKCSVTYNADYSNVLAIDCI